MSLIKRVYAKLECSLEFFISTGKLIVPKDQAPNPRDSDIYLVSYPKCGNTWMRYLLAYSIWPNVETLDLIKMASYIPSVNISYDIKTMLDLSAPCNREGYRIIKSHFRYNPVAKRVIFIVRDGRDALVSYWHFCNQRDGTFIPFSQFLEQPQPYGPWREYVLEWINAPVKKIVIRYEDMLEDTTACLRKALDFIEVSVEKKQVERAVQKASFESLKKIEREKGLNLEQLKNVKFMRKGVAGSWKETFRDGDIERFDRLHGGPMPELGYLW